MDAEILTLETVRGVFTKQITAMNAKISTVTENLVMITKERRSGEVSVYTEVDSVFQRNSANRTHYFGRQFQGKDISKIMDKSDKFWGSNDSGGDARHR